MTGISDYISALQSALSGGSHSIAGAPGAPIGTFAPAPLPYDMQMEQAKRQQVLAEAMRQQSTDDIKVQSYKGTQAAIPWTAVLAKALQGYGANLQEGRAATAQQAAATADQARAEAGVKDLTDPVMHAGAPAIAPVDSTVSAPTPQLPGQPPPSGPAPSAPITLPGAQGTPAAMGTPYPQQQMATLARLLAQGGPASGAVANLYGPGVQAEIQANLAQNRPMSRAAREEAQLNLENQETAARYGKTLPSSPQELAELALKKRELDISELKNQQQHAYQMAMTGQGFTEDGLPNPAVQSWVKFLAGGGDMRNVPAGLRTPVANALAGAPEQFFTPAAKQKYATMAKTIAAPFLKTPNYTNAATGFPQLQRMDAALKHTGSVADQELLDSFTQLSKGGGQVTEAQLAIITKGQSLSDWYNVQMQRLKKGGVLSDEQRQDMAAIARDTYKNYQRSYQPVYDQVTSQLKAAHVPEWAWSMPDLNKLNSGQGILGDGAASSEDQQALAWANANSKDPRAAAIKSRLGH